MAEEVDQELSRLATSGRELEGDIFTLRAELWQASGRLSRSTFDLYRKRTSPSLTLCTPVHSPRQLRKL